MGKEKNVSWFAFVLVRGEIRFHLMVIVGGEKINKEMGIPEKKGCKNS